MISSEEQITRAATSDNDLLLYDYFKHLTTLALVALGGAISIAKGAIATSTLGTIVFAIGLGGGLALIGLLAVVRERLAGKPTSRYVRWLRTASGVLFTFGVGMFLVVMMRSVG